MTDHKLVLTTVGSEEEARKIAQALVARRLVACVNIVPQITSVYRWQGKVENAQEVLLLIKTTADGFVRVRDALQELHSYELPECISMTIDDGSPAYLRWIGESVE
jgi:periplasmic divalent cation tolerance protein